MPRRYERDGHTQYVAQGFSWPCFFLSSLWALWRGNWTAFWAYMALYVLSFSTALAGSLAGHDLTRLCSLAGTLYHLIVCFFANSWLEEALRARRWKLTP